MVKKLFALSIVLSLLCGCGVDLYAYQRPNADENEKWISEEPRMYFTWTKDVGGYWGEIETNGVTTKVRVFFDYGCGVFIDKYTESLSSENRLFNGQCKFGKDELVVTVTEDYADLFHGDLPTFVFKREEKGED